MSVHAQPDAGFIRASLCLRQNENGRLLQITMRGITIPVGSVATLTGTKPDGNVYSTAGTISGNVISIQEDKSLKKQIPVFQSQYEHIIIDGAPQSDRISAICIYAADLVIIPVMPSPYDLWATASILERVSATKEIQPDKKAFFLLNRVNDKATLSKDTAEALSSLGYPVFNTRLHNRIAYADSASCGLSVLEASNPKAKAEMESLYNEIKPLLKGK